MKKINMLTIFLLIGFAAFAQSNPAAQSLPYSEDFSGLSHTSTAYPSGWLGWQVTTTLGSTYNTAAPTADKALAASSSASTTAGNVHNYNGKIGCLNSGSSGDLALVLSVNTTGKSNIAVAYDIMTIRNPYDGTSNTRINEVTLQFRVGTSGSFTTLTGIEYQNNTTLATTSGSTTPQNNESKSITLPSSCNNQSEVQLRWISRQVSGAGSRPSFAVDNISVAEKVSRSLAVAAKAQAFEATSPVAGSFTFTFTPACTTATTFDYTITGSAAFNTDYTVTLDRSATPSAPSAASGTITVPSGTTSIIAAVTPVNDNTPEGEETIIITISNPSDNYTLGDAVETLSITDDDPALIHHIQGSGTTAMNGNNLVEAIVTGIYPGLSPAGFYIQEEDTDVDSTYITSEGLFVVSSALVTVGDKVRVSGTVLESGASPSFGQAVIYNANVTVLSSGNKLPRLQDIYLPLSTLTDLESFEGMLVRFVDKLTVTDNYNLGRFGEIHLSQGGLVYQPTQIEDPNDAVFSGTTSSGSSNVAAINALVKDNALRTVLLDDGTGTMTSLPFVDSSNNLRVGSTVRNLQGIMGYGFSSYRVQPIPSAIPVFTYAARPEMPGIGKNNNIKVASFNVLNYFNGNGQGGGFPTARGAHSAAEFTRQRVKIINAIAEINADIVGLTEIENDGTDSNSAIADLVKGLNTKMGAGTYAYIFDGAAIQAFGTDAIKCAIIYKPAAVKPIGRALLSSNAAFNRPPLAQTFRVLATCSDFTYVINHFKSKSATGAAGADIDQLDGQGAYNDRRRQQSSELVKFIKDSVIVFSGSDRVISMGDYNSYYEEDPMDILRDSGYKVQSTAKEYSYQFDGQLGSLDYAVTSKTMSSLITGVAKWNINAAEPTHLGYDDNINDASGDFVNQWSATYTPIPFRSSDHDPVLVGIKFPSELSVVNLVVTPSNNMYTGGVSTNIYLGYGPQTASVKANAKGGSGFTYAWSPAANLSCSTCQTPVFTPTAPGVYTFEVTVTNSRGCAATSSVSFCVKNVVVPGNTNKVYVCHNGNTNEVAINAVAAHLANHNGDFLGKCDDNTCGSENLSSKRSQPLTVSEGNIDSHISEIKIYPNPVAGELFVNLPEELGHATVIIKDMAGKEVLRYEQVKGLVQVPTDNLSKGIYLVEVQSGEQFYKTLITHH